MMQVFTASALSQTAVFESTEADRDESASKLSTASQNNLLKYTS